MSRSERGLDWFTFFVADLQTGFGPFLAVYLSTQKWNQADIGLILAVGSLAGLASQLPAGWFVDMAPSKRRVAMLAVVGHWPQRAADRAGTLFPRHHDGQAPARGLEFAAGARHCRHHPWIGWPRRGGRAAWTQCALCLHRQRSRRRRDGSGWISDFAAGGFPGHGCSGAADLACAQANSRKRDRRGAGRRRHRSSARLDPPSRRLRSPACCASAP